MHKLLGKIGWTETDLLSCNYVLYVCLVMPVTIKVGLTEDGNQTQSLKK